MKSHPNDGLKKWRKNKWFFSRILPGNVPKLVPRGGRKSNLMFLFWPGCIWGARGFPWSSQVTPSSIFTWFLQNSRLILAVCLQRKQNKSKNTFKQDDRETSCKSNGWQRIPRWGRLARTCENQIMEHLRGGGVGRSPLDKNDLQLFVFLSLKITKSPFHVLW